MDIDNQISSEKIKKQWQVLAAKLSSLWSRIYRLVFVIFFALCVAYAAYVWRQNISNPVGWSQAQKTEFLSAQQSGVAFKQADFEKSITNIGDRQTAFSADYPSIKNVFLPYK